MGIIDCLGPVDIQCIPGTWGGGGLHVMGITGCLGSDLIQFN